MAEHAKFQVEVLSPDGEVFAEEVQMISTKTVIGSIGVLANHAPLLAELAPTELRLYRTESEIVRFAQSEGYLQVGGNRALLLVQEAHDPGSLDAGELRARLEEVQRELDRGDEQTERRRVAKREKRRLEAFLRIAESA
jgi:F-type H+-transporting ATPase subunit epsilon